MTANNKLLVLIIKSQLNKRKAEYRLVQNVAFYKAHLK
jgi:hypothetical protein